MKIKFFSPLILCCFFSLFLFCQSAFAFEDVIVDDNSGVSTIRRENDYGGTNIQVDIDKGYCIHAYEQIFENKLYTCNNVRSVWYQYEAIKKPENSAWFKFQCWQAFFSAIQNTASNNYSAAGIITSQEYYYSSVAPNPDYTLHPCRLKVVSQPGSCEINSSQIISLAFAQKFPLDLFIGLKGFSSDSVCPQFNVNNRTFELCYIVKLAKSLKYVILLVFILSSIIAL